MRLQIGCLGDSIPGFKRLDIVQHGDIDFVQDASDLSNFDSGTIEEIYASHILEHFPKPIVSRVLKEWQRVLKPGGILWCGVPDFDAIVDVYLKNDRNMTTWLGYLIHGDQKNDHSYHLNVFTYPMLAGELSMSGFSRISRIDEFPYNIDDASKSRDSWFKLPISLNIKAVK